VHTEIASRPATSRLSQRNLAEQSLYADERATLDV
jgi:hypothetical protein